MNERIEVDAKALRQLLAALNGQPHEIRELMVLRDAPAIVCNDDPITTLTTELNTWAATPTPLADAAAIAEREAHVSELERIAHELRTYNPAADEYKGKHIHKVWARKLDAVAEKTRAQIEAYASFLDDTKNVVNPYARHALMACIADCQSLSYSEDRGITVSEAESIGGVLHELRRLQNLEAEAVEIVTRESARAALATTEATDAIARDVIWPEPNDTATAVFDDAIAPTEVALPFQARVQPWMMECFGAEIAADRIERNHRFFEEATELVQANGMTRSEAHQLVDYTFDRPIGELHQEVGGVMVTLAALCLASGQDMHAAGETELARIWTKVEAIRAKQAAKPKHSPLPAAPSPEAPAVDAGA